MPEQDNFMTVYATPDELNLPQIRDSKRFNLEVFSKEQLQPNSQLKDFVPHEFISDTLNGAWSGKWIYFSLGSMGSIDLKLVTRLLDVFAKTNHKYIVSKGPRHAKYDLPRNAWGERFLPQTKLVPLVDLIIAHGGNNTTTESFAQVILDLLVFQ